MKKVLFYLLFAAGMSFLTSCATILTGTTQTVKVASYPPGATVEIDGANRGKTPLDLTLQKGFKGESVVLKMEGYETKTLQPKVAFNPMSFLNMLGLIGWAVDGATGAIMKYDPKYYEVTLDKKP